MPFDQETTLKIKFVVRLLFTELRKKKIARLLFREDEEEEEKKKKEEMKEIIMISRWHS